MRRKILRKVLFAQAQVVSLKRGDGSGATVAAHGVSGGGARREILGEISPSTGQVSGAINASAEQMLRLKSAGMFWQSRHAKSREWNERAILCSMYCA